MTEHAHSVDSTDRQFLRRTAILVVAWTSLFLLASAGLVTYGDVLMELFA